jgi:hypothetical protein
LFVIGNFTVVQFGGGQLEVYEAGISEDGDFIVRPPIHTTHSNAIIQQPMPRLKRKLHVFLLARLQSPTHRQNVKNFIDRQLGHLLLLFLFALVVFVFLLHLMKMCGLFFQEAPLVVHGHFGNVV